MAVSTPREGDWRCPSCSNNNYANRVVCNRCNAPKMVDSASQQMNMYAMLAQQIGGMGYGAAPARPIPNANRSSPYGAVPVPAAEKGDMRQGDWVCPSCNNHNFANRVQCNKCKVPKGGINFPGFPSGGKGGKTPSTPNLRPGDWMCRSCSNHNYASRDTCNKCAVPKNVFIAKSGMREGDWLCPACNNHNFADKHVCKKCSAPKGNAKTPPGAVAANANSERRDGDWTCMACSNHNYANREVCNRCQHPKL